MLQRVLAKSRSLASAQSRRTLNQETQQRRRCTTNAESEGQHASNSNSLFAKEFFEERKKFVADFVVRNGDKALYPPFVGKHQIKDFTEKYAGLTAGEKIPEDIYTLTGRILTKREASKKLTFYTVRSGNATVQVMSSQSDYPDADNHSYINKNLRRGDIIAITGYPYKTKTGEMSIAAKQLDLLSPCLHELPDFNGLQDKELRYRNRHIDLLMNKGIKDVFITRSKIINSLRRFLDDRGFTEVETPMLQRHASGAIADPFKTHLEALKEDLYLRIAPELYLKQLIVGGMDRVYEIGKSFRNEGIDLTHNPEFTTCEFYQAYTDYTELMTTTEEIFRHIVKSVTGSYKIKINVPRKKGRSDDLEEIEIDFEQPFRVIDMIPELEKILRIQLPDVNDIEAREVLRGLCEKHGIDTISTDVSTKLLDRLVEHFLESQCIQPTFIINYPQVISPLARSHRDRPGLTERFELFVGRMELCNAYTELNDPVEQRKRFIQQVDVGEALKYNEEWFCNVLEWAMPPTGGWGMGIDRLTMLLTNKMSIKEVLLFPFMKEIQKQQTPNVQN